jgi:hypothetical protein
MDEKRIVTRADLPQFTVDAMEMGETYLSGDIEWTLKGRLNNVKGVIFDGWTYLMLPNQYVLCGNFSTPVGADNETSFVAWSREKPDVVGMQLASLSPYWQPYNIWTIEDGPDAWSLDTFVTSDAVAEIVAGTDGQPLRGWRKASESEIAELPKTQPDSSQPQRWILSGGWDHDHCELCMCHIHAGDEHYRHSEWCAFLCLDCYGKYVPSRNIEFALPY